MLFYFIENYAVRMLGAFLCSLLMVLSFGNPVIDYLRKHQKKGQPIRKDGPKTHLKDKKGTPTMGGLLILASTILTVLLWANLDNAFVWVAILVMLVYGAVGLADDYVKVKKQTANAMTAKMKLILQFSTSLIAILIVSKYTPQDVRFLIDVPFLPNLIIDFWLFYVPFAMVVIAGASNAVNLSDGLDGLASSLLISAFSTFAICSYFVANAFHPIPMADEVLIVCAATVGALLGFLYFNKKPARVFMGDTGSLALGALLGTVAVMLKSEFVLAVVGFVFVLEALSVMIQVFWYKRTKRRVFLMAPIHHHFEQKGWSEKKVVRIFFLASVICALLGFAVFYWG